MHSIPFVPLPIEKLDHSPTLYPIVPKINSHTSPSCQIGISDLESVGLQGRLLPPRHTADFGLGRNEVVRKSPLKPTRALESILGGSYLGELSGCRDFDVVIANLDQRQRRQRRPFRTARNGHQ